MRENLFLVVGVLLITQMTFADPPSLVGTWKIAAFQDDGKDRLARLGAAPAKKNREPRFAKLVFTSEACYVIRGDGRREMASGLTNAGWKSYTRNDSTAPKSIDIMGFSGKQNEKTKSYPGIYEITDNRLRICYAESGSKRPATFESNGQNNLFECERISKVPLPLPKVSTPTSNSKLK